MYITQKSYLLYGQHFMLLVTRQTHKNSFKLRRQWAPTISAWSTGRAYEGPYYDASKYSRHRSPSMSLVSAAQTGNYPTQTTPSSINALVITAQMNQLHTSHDVLTKGDKPFSGNWWRFSLTGWISLDQTLILWNAWNNTCSAMAKGSMGEVAHHFPKLHEFACHHEILGWNNFM